MDARVRWRRAIATLVLLGLGAACSLLVATAGADSNSTPAVQLHLDTLQNTSTSGDGTTPTGTTPDSSPNHLAATASGTPINDGRFQGALNMGYSDNGVTVPDTAALRPTAGVTVMGWVRDSVNPGANRMVLGKAFADGCKRLAYGLITGPTGGLEFDTTTFNDGDQETATPESQPSGLWDGHWHAIAGTYDGNTMRLWIDGTLAESQVVGHPLDYNTSTDPGTGYPDDTGLYAGQPTPPPTPAGRTALRLLQLPLRRRHRRDPGLQPAPEPDRDPVPPGLAPLHATGSPAADHDHDQLEHDDHATIEADGPVPDGAHGADARSDRLQWSRLPALAGWKHRRLSLDDRRGGYADRRHRLRQQSGVRASVPRQRRLSRDADRDRHARAPRLGHRAGDDHRPHTAERDQRSADVRLREPGQGRATEPLRLHQDLRLRNPRRQQPGQAERLLRGVTEPPQPNLQDARGGDDRRPGRDQRPVRPDTGERKDCLRLQRQRLGPRGEPVLRARRPVPDPDVPGPVHGQAQLPGSVPPGQDRPGDEHTEVPRLAADQRPSLDRSDLPPEQGRGGYGFALAVHVRRQARRPRAPSR